LPFIAELKRRNHVISLNNEIDYRTQGVYLSDTYFHPLNADTEAKLATAFETVCGEETPRSMTIAVAQGRTLTAEKAVDHAAYFTFDQLCSTTVGSADFQAIAAQFSTVFIAGIPQMTVDQLNWTRRFITLVDELYQLRVRVVVSAEAPPHQLLKTDMASDNAPDEVFAFERCVSRLTEMQSKEYLDQALHKHDAV
jgi:cell division protein ZapE